MWWGVHDASILALYQPENEPYGAIHWQTFPEPDQHELFRSLFRLEVSLDALYSEWISRDPVIAPAVEAFRGLRIMRQNVHECFFGFQCASCNTVVKIERSVAKLAERYGDPLPLPEWHGGKSMFAFPSPAQLSIADEAHLRADLWGFRAPRVISLARTLHEAGEDWLATLRRLPYEDAHSKLTSLNGIGAKVADCICLFCLDKDDAVPIDTHTRQIATRLFDTSLSGSSLTPRVYRALAEMYRSRFGAFAGWAQQYLFFAELRRSEQYSIRTKGSSLPAPCLV